MIFGKKKRSFRKEFKRQLRLAIGAAIGFSVAFAWRNFIWNGVQSFIVKMNQSTNILLNDFWTAVAVTFFAVILLFITSRLLRE